MAARFRVAGLDVAGHIANCDFISAVHAPVRMVLFGSVNLDAGAVHPSTALALLFIQYGV